MLLFAKQEVEKEFCIPVVHIVALEHLVSFLGNADAGQGHGTTAAVSDTAACSGEAAAALQAEVVAYRARYGVRMV